VTIKSLAKNADTNLPVFQGLIKDVSILGHGETPWHRDEHGLHINGPAIKQNMPVVVKIRVD
jgi:hypothetical protein